MKISVLMSVFNTRKDFLMEAVESILNQTYQNFEFIIIDDGSTKREISDILAEYKRRDNRIIILKNEKNMGLTKSLNKGLSIAKGKYIARMDSDDISVLNRLEKQIDYMEKHKDIAVLGSKVKIFGKKQAAESGYYIDYMQGCYEKFKIKMFFVNAGPVHPAVMMRKEFLDKHGIRYNESIKKAQDYCLWIDCILNGGKIYNYPEILLHYRMHEDQISAKNRKEQDKYARVISMKALIGAGFEIEERDFGPLSLLNADSFEYKVEDYIFALHKLCSENHEKQIFNEKLFENEIKHRWLHKVIKCTCRSRDCSGFFNKFTYECLFSAALVDWIKNHILKID